MGAGGQGLGREGGLMDGFNGFTAHTVSAMQGWMR